MADRFGDLVLTNQDRTDDRSVQRDAEAGHLVRVADGIYVSSARRVEEVLRSQWAPLLNSIAPGAVLSGRSALRKGIWIERSDVKSVAWLFATDPNSKVRRSVSLPGLELRTTPGVGALDGDVPYLGIFLPSDARCFLENLKPSRSRHGPSRGAGREAVELEVDRLFETYRDDGLRELRRRAEALAPCLGAAKELEVLEAIVGAVAGTRKAKLASTSVAARRRKSDPYDAAWLKRLGGLASDLNRVTLPDRPDPHIDPSIASATSFVEAYFTNYIEGTRFLVDTAVRVVFNGEIPEGRPKDGRDVSQAYEQIAGIKKGAARAATANEFLDEIMERNAKLMAGRPENSPGVFKKEANRAGNTVFVAPELVRGTLREAFVMLESLEHPFGRAAFVHSTIVTVHPFNDGNGRLARIMMTKELVGAGQCRIIVPTVFRADYIDAVRAQCDGACRAAPLVRALIKLQEVTARIAVQGLDATVALWASTHGFLEDERGARLTMPDASVPIEWRSGIPAPGSYWREVDLAFELDDLVRTFGSLT